MSVRVTRTMSREQTISPLDCVTCGWSVDNAGGDTRRVFALAREHVAENPGHAVHVEQVLAVWFESAPSPEVER